ncbi:hypothetical protein RCL_jg9058.t1 [Rhizophagus clarus]|uniref:Uncharacterized protein n=1 Tax=Rhizophagus clarus TaxID=94130 RepID=A0A8H3KX77_9GLOM|nr:hypothetical protein RCL_jg9058.t1 [Rhizophagus clarus]
MIKMNKTKESEKIQPTITHFLQKRNNLKICFATSSTTEQHFILLNDNEEYLSTDNEEEEADVESNIDA